MVTALLHDIGKLVLMHAYPGYPAQVHQGARTPEERIHRERRELGVDHALVGGVLARRWGLPKAVASVIERHHSDDADGEAAFVRLAEGKVYKQIALELDLSTSTVRTHMHNIYGKLGAVDRAQAVLLATERGWL